MSGLDLLVANHVDLSVIRTAIAATLGMEIEQIAVLEDIEDAPNDAQVLCTCIVNRISCGEFLTHLSIYTDMGPEHMTWDWVLAVFAKSFGCRCLASDESLNPYTMSMASPDGSVQAVSLDVHSLDDCGEYRVVEEEGGRGQYTI